MHALAFIIWDIGSRPPSRLVSDLRGGFSSARVLVRGLWRFGLGTVILLAGALLMLGITLFDVRTEFTVLETIAIVAGLFVETLVGATIRAHIATR